MKESSEITRKLPGRTHYLNDREYLYFSGTSYLGLSTYEPWIRLIKDGLDTYGTAFGSSRRTNVPLDIYGELEQSLANWIGTEACVSCSSGTLAGRLILEYVQRFDDVFYMPNSHPASWDRHSGIVEEDMQTCIDRMIACGHEKDDGQPLCIITNSVDPLTPKLTSIEWMNDITYSGPIYLFVDDSHGLGVLGEEGKGFISGLKLPVNISMITYGSLSKGIGIQGGWIAADYDIVFEIMNLPLFGGSSPMSPAFAYTLHEGLEIIKDRNSILRENINHLREKFFTEEYFNTSPELPVFTSTDPDLTKYLYKRGILISDFSYPGPEDPRYIRIVLNAMHRQEDLNTLAFYLQQHYEPNKL